MSNEFISINELIKRDLNFKSGVGKYQIQAGENCTNAKIVKFDKEIPDVCIFEYDIDDFKCSLIQYSLSEDDLEKKRLKMIGFLIKNKKGFIVGLLDLVFISDEDTKIMSFIIGKFDVILANSKEEKKIIKSMTSYLGNGNIVHMMIGLMGECLENIIDEN